MNSGTLKSMHRKVADFCNISTDCFLNAKGYSTPHACDCRRVYYYVLNRPFDIDAKIIASMFGLKRGAINYIINIVRQGGYSRATKELLKHLIKELTE